MSSLGQIQSGARVIFWSSSHSKELEGIFLYWIATPGVRYAQVFYYLGTERSSVPGVKGIHESRIRKFQNVERYEPMQEVSHD